MSLRTLGSHLKYNIGYTQKKETFKRVDKIKTLLRKLSGKIPGLNVEWSIYKETRSHFDETLYCPFFLCGDFHSIGVPYSKSSLYTRVPYVDGFSDMKSDKTKVSSCVVSSPTDRVFEILNIKIFILSLKRYTRVTDRVKRNIFKNRLIFCLLDEKVPYSHGTLVRGGNGRK